MELNLCSFRCVRYLWPLIHYHKFLAKCIKKLKRNNVDVKTSLSPVSAFLREEVCAVSDHLAATSKFTSDEWMEVSGMTNFLLFTCLEIGKGKNSLILSFLYTRVYLISMVGRNKMKTANKS